ncbi:MULTISPECIES: LysR substrate-binding domain-containing protein [Pseudomonas]|uniref:LysR substrate-binding domain-containing protein n=1 Tax=Pseudomonas shirazica TaxID=1940636 RepID=A0ABY9SIQ8_9PSED|nr:MULTISPECIES: LysR substrate-binding domain-containing protein [Pseudomonas]KXK69604.1 LysR family transcriptional regulator [Pseudomonas monteilii]AGA74349.1 LysR family transcriptional regulator [Pseudomonas putida HB3267]MCE0751914.1 LysR substrate-binding domain-containing protein [Pseudomonas asiatica]MCE0942125.1 LysR substrate-binding domain-containing protein [Pseudomonas asiatica]MCE0953224.1 LysR substrate-binding domain-containing protein [Pseudomonas asiatica]
MSLDILRKSPQIPSLKAIQAFEQVARFANVARAAEQLNLTPSAVSHQIANLEALIGRPLFIREARGVALTPAGEQYLREVSGILQSLATATERAGNSVGFDCLRLHSAPSFGLLWLLPRLDHFRNSHPQIQINLSCSYESLHFGRHQIDLDIRHGYPNWPSLEVRTIRHERATVLASPQLLERTPIKQPGDLLGQNLILSEAALVQWPQWFAQQGVALPQTPYALSFDRSYMSLEAASHGYGVALESSLLAQDYIARGELVPVFAEDLATPVSAHHLVFPRGHAETPRVRQFLEWMQGQLGHDFNY